MGRCNHPGCLVYHTSEYLVTPDLPTEPTDYDVRFNAFVHGKPTVFRMTTTVNEGRGKLVVEVDGEPLFTYYGIAFDKHAGDERDRNLRDMGEALNEQKSKGFAMGYRVGREEALTDKKKAPQNE